MVSRYYILRGYPGTYILSGYPGTYILWGYPGTYVLWEYPGTIYHLGVPGTYIFWGTQVPYMLWGYPVPIYSGVPGYLPRYDQRIYILLRYLGTYPSMTQTTRFNTQVEYTWYTLNTPFHWILHPAHLRRSEQTVAVHVINGPEHIRSI